METTFLLDKDYRMVVRDEVKQILMQADNSVLKMAEETAIEEIKSYLSGRYDVAKIFVQLYRFIPNQQWGAEDYVYNTDDTVYKALVDSPGDDFTDAGDWQASDPRNKLVVSFAVKVAVYHLHSHISPRNIPELRVKQYDDTIAFLKLAANGKTNIDLPLLEDVGAQGTFRLGSNLKTSQRW
ncbi:MAG: DUF1320 domain-containing protein [Bacteroidetes bacterium]|nr:MAG: DUF1320 domain-containing protein [Bacteroidota bacterium]